jgi:hypothetical protein
MEQAMTMNHDEAIQLQEQIARDHPELRCNIGQYESAWVVTVTNPRTNESFGIVSPTDWQDRLNTMQGLEPRRS